MDYPEKRMAFERAFAHRNLTRSANPVYGETYADRRTQALWDGWLGALRFTSTVKQQERGEVAWELRQGHTDKVLMEITNDPTRAHNWRISFSEDLVVPLYYGIK